MSTTFHKLSYLLLPLLLLSIPALGNTAQIIPPDNKDVKFTLYKEECASCHMAYPAWLLPARSWQKIMSNLNQHFGDDASLDPASLQAISQYLQDNSADTNPTRRASKILRSVSQEDTPVRISELPYIQRKHREIPGRLINDNPRVNSLSNCAACHQTATQGVFDDDHVRIPGYGRWDD